MTTDTAPGSGEVLILDGAAHVWVSLGLGYFACLTDTSLPHLDWQGMSGTRGITDTYDRRPQEETP